MHFGSRLLFQKNQFINKSLYESVRHRLSGYYGGACTPFIHPCDLLMAFFAWFFGDWCGIVGAVGAETTTDIREASEVRFALRDSPGSGRWFA
jgi:hypothetical protein